MRNPEKPAAGEVVTYVDEVSVEHDALVTVYWGGESEGSALNCVYVTKDDTKRDPYGQQLERASSVSRFREGVTAHGRYWKPKV